MTPQEIIELAALVVGQCLTAGAIYGAIRSDIKHMRGDLDRHEHQIDRAHARIDTLKGNAA